MSGCWSPKSRYALHTTASFVSLLLEKLGEVGRVSSPGSVRVCCATFSLHPALHAPRSLLLILNNRGGLGDMTSQKALKAQKIAPGMRWKLDLTKTHGLASLGGYWREGYCVDPRIL